MKLKKLLSLFLLCFLSFPLQAQLWEESDTDLIKAVAQQDYKRCVKLLNDGVDPNEKNYKDASPLMFAALLGDSATSDLLLEKGANVDVTNKAGYTAILLAREGGFDALADKLLTHSKDKSLHAEKSWISNRNLLTVFAIGCFILLKRFGF